MRKIALQQFSQMQLDLERCRQQEFNEEKQIECCYQICLKYWGEIQRKLSNYQFDNDEEEIEFFKNVKPMYTSEIEFYNLLYHAYLFQPVYGLEDLSNFWQRESQRLTKFVESHIEFCDYYRNKQNSFDQFYYLRRNFSQEEAIDMGLNELERKSSTSHDHLAGELLGLERYNDYAHRQLKKIKSA